MEVWKEIKGYEGYYQISSLGNVRSVDRYVGHPTKGVKRFCKGKLLKKLYDKDGYAQVNLKMKQKGNTQRIHRLVCLHFIENKENKPQVNHKNGVKSDNRLENLEWATLSENRQHAYDTGLQNSLTRQGSKNNFSKLKKHQVLSIRKEYTGDARGLNPDKLKGMITSVDLAKKYNVTQSCISDILTRKTWNHV